jgi:hypothetical protein
LNTFYFVSTFISSTFFVKYNFPAETWCIENGFELVELNPQEDEPDPEVEDIFLESTGVKRILQALHAHMWPNLIMKGRLLDLCVRSGCILIEQ